MKQTILRKLMLIAVLLTSSHAFAHDFEVDGIYYNITSDSDLTVEVTYKGDSYDEYYDEYTGSVVIPTSVTYNSKTYSVTSIRYGAFTDCTGLTSVTIGNSVTKIGSYAFEGCTGLTEITIPNCVTSIGDHAFYECANLTTVNFNAENCTTMGSDSFPVFELCKNLTTINIGDKVKTIPSYAFHNCGALTSVIIPNSVTSIAHHAFYRSGLTSVTIGNSVTKIGSYAFEGCTELTSVTIGNRVTKIDSNAFNYCTSLTEITIPNSVTEIGFWAFRSCWALTSVIIPNSVTKIDQGAFSYCTGLTSVTIPNSVTEIGVEAFYNTPFFNNQPDGVIYLGRVLYNYKGSMPMNTSIFVKEGTVSISYSAFHSCTGLTSITIPNSVTFIGNYAFYRSGLTEIICESSTPATAYSYSFRYIPTTATLYVPVGSRDAYASATGWNVFTNIIEDDLKTGVESTLADDVNVAVENGNIIVNGVDNENIEVYSMNGECVYTGTTTTIPVSLKGLYIVKVNDKSFKVIL